MTPQPVLHLIGNAHPDPVRLWDRAEGMARAVATMRAIVPRMHGRPELTFIQGELMIHNEVQRQDSEKFAAIAAGTSCRYRVCAVNAITPSAYASAIPSTAPCHHPALSG